MLKNNDIYSNDVEGAAYFEDNRARDEGDYEILTRRDFNEEDNEDNEDEE